MDNFWHRLFWGNTLQEWMIAAAAAIICMAVLKILRGVTANRLHAWSLKTKNTLDDFIVRVLKRSVFPLLYLGTIYAAASYLKLPARLDKALNIAFLFITTFFILQIITALIRQFIFSCLKRDDNATQQKQAQGIIIIVNVVIWVLGVVFLIDNLGYNVTTIVTGLGIGGIALALAAQTVLGDLFSYFVIFFDRPFEPGDFIVLDDKMGTVEYIGIKTTRLKTLSGEQLICANTDLTGARVHNFKRMEKRRVLFTLGVSYQTTHGMLQKIPEMVKGIITAKPDVEYDRGHFSGFGDFSLNFEFVYHITGADYNLFMDRQQAVYLDIFEAFQREGIGFAYPTQTVFIHSQNGADIVKNREAHSQIGVR